MPRRLIPLAATYCWWFVLAPISVHAADFLRDVKPILAARCFRCHSAAFETEAGLQLDRFASLMKGGENGPVVAPGNAVASKLLARVAAVDETRMPPQGERLTAAQIATLKAWIDAGAIGPSAEEESQVKHWAFTRPVRPTPPIVGGEANIRNPIDALTAAQRTEHKLTPLGEAPRETLLRRVYFDLIGLPPTPAQLDEFLRDDSPLAYDRVVEQLLASPHYGERWGRHWMDVWRYSDWDGYGQEIRESQRHIWRWRDWIVESLNANKPYDRMIQEMLAADELAPDDTDAMRATGYLARSWYKFNRNQWLDQAIEHVGKGFMGVTFNCARCHHHMYDPIEQREYYQLRAIFEPYDVRADRAPGEMNAEKDGLARVFDANAAAPTYLFVRGNEKNPVADQPLSPGVPKLFADVGFQVTPVTLPAVAAYPGLREFVRRDALAGADGELASARGALDLARRKLAEGQAKSTPAAELSEAAFAVRVAESGVDVAERQRAAIAARIEADKANYSQPPAAAAKTLALAAGIAERQVAAAQARRSLVEAEQRVVKAERALQNGDKALEKAASDARQARDKASEAVQAAIAAVAQPNENYTRLTPTYPATSTGRRLALARFVASTKNPLTARVAINHMWLRHYGAPLVATMFDFGMNGKPPSHPLLLDWLATEFMSHGWDMKHLHRIMVTSATYRLASAAPANDQAAVAAAEIDPENRYYWRANVRRLEAEAVRDATLFVAGSLDPSLGGPDLDAAAGLTNPRRSVYFRSSKEKRVTFLALFDGPSVVECYRRSDTVTPQQALAMSNSPLALDQARVLARRLTDSLVDRNASELTDAFVTAAFRRVLCRGPSTAELAACREFLADQQARLAAPAKLTPFVGGPAAATPPAADPAQRARESLVHVLLNHNDFVTVR